MVVLGGMQCSDPDCVILAQSYGIVPPATIMNCAGLGSGSELWCRGGGVSCWAVWGRQPLSGTCGFVDAVVVFVTRLAQQWVSCTLLHPAAACKVTVVGCQRRCAQQLEVELVRARHVAQSRR